MLEKLSAVREAAKTIDKCPKKCVNGEIELLCEGKPFWWPCPLMSRECEYGRRLYAQFLERARSAVLGLDIPRVHVANFSKPKKTVALSAAEKWDLRGFLTLIGPTDSGKSFAAAWAAKRFAAGCFEPEAWKNPQMWSIGTERAQNSILWCHIHELLEDDSVRGKAVGVRFLVVDDLASEDATPRVKGIVNYLIARRYDDKLPTVITANLTREELEERYGERIMDRLINAGEVVDCKPCSLRAIVG